jgi:hypothetical protein
MLSFILKCWECQKLLEIEVQDRPGIEIHGGNPLIVIARIKPCNCLAKGDSNENHRRS